MKSKVLYHVPMGANGKFILRSMQDNNEMPLVDLFVRESLQNSLDAGIGTGNKFVNVNYVIGKFDVKKLNSVFEGSTDLLNKANLKDDYILIKDSNTVGLNGRIKDSEYKESEDFENCRKLIYEFGEPQVQDGSGGSWGLGKTIYYRMGEGFVIYYSQYKTSTGKYASRLAAALIENNKKMRFIPKEKTDRRRIGIAFWGKNDGDYSIPLDDKEDMTEIEKILNIFGIKKFDSTETGTCVIIPYVDLDKCLLTSQYECKNAEGDLTPLPWAKDFNKTLSLAIQRWYFPRILNTKYLEGKAPFLKVLINDQEITLDKFSSIFSLYWDMYRFASVDFQPKIDSFTKKNNVELYKHTLTYSSKTLGTFVYTVFDNSNHLFIPEPYRYLNYNSEYNCPIIAFVRKPGQIISYNLGVDWLPHNYDLSPDQYIIGIFVLNSDCNIQGSTLEAYIKSGERSAHTKWIDQPLEGESKCLTYVSNIQNKIKKILNEKLIKNSKVDITFNPSVFSTKYNWLLPSANIGRGTGIAPGGKKGIGNKSGSGPKPKPRPKTNKMELQLISERAVFIKKSMILEYILFPGDNPGPAVIEIKVALESSKPIPLKEWADDMNLKEPFELHSVNQSKTFNNVEWLKTKNKKVYGISFDGSNTPKEGNLLKISIDIFDKGYIPVIELAIGGK